MIAFYLAVMLSLSSRIYYFIGSCTYAQQSNYLKVVSVICADFALCVGICYSLILIGVSERLMDCRIRIVPVHYTEDDVNRLKKAKKCFKISKYLFVIEFILMIALYSYSRENIEQLIIFSLLSIFLLMLNLDAHYRYKDIEADKADQNEKKSENCFKRYSFGIT